MQHPARHSTLIASAALTLAAIALPARAQMGPADEAAQAAAETPVEAEATETPAPDKKKKKTDLLFAPVPFSSPTTGAGIAGGVVAFYNPNDGPHQWVSGGGIVWTSRGSKGIGLFHKMSSADDRFRVSATASYFDARENFYGIGEEDGDRGDALDLVNKKLSLQVRAQMRAFRHGYVGIRYRLVSNDARPEADAVSSTPPPPADQLHSTLSMAGPIVAYDTRDNHDQPRRGLNLSASWIFGLTALGDSYDHDKLQLNGSAYFPVGAETILATNAALCSANGDVPYYDLCLFGSNGVLRGYPSGRYRDGASWAVQGELRHHIAKRWGGVAFVGVGGIAPQLGDLLDDGNLLPAAGIGVRYRPFKDNDVQLRLDLAVGKDAHGVYLGIGEAF